MKRQVLSAAIALALCGAAHSASVNALTLEVLGSYDTGLADIGDERTAGEVVAVRGERMYVANASDVSVDIVDIEDPASPRLVKRVDLSRHGAGINSIDVSAHNLVAVALEAEDKTEPGTIAFLTPAGKVIRTARVGALPDMVTFTPDGRRLLVANEGEPDCYGDGCTDPMGSVSVVTVVPMRPVLPVATIGFEGVELPAGVRVFGPGASAAQDLEPEYITVSADGRSAWVSLQENNAIAALDLDTNQVREVFALGYKDHGVAGAGLDASDREVSSTQGTINIQPWARVKGMYQPDALASFTVDGETFVVSANEGDARDYDGFAEEERARDLRNLPGFEDIAAIPGIGTNAELGRLTVTSARPFGADGNVYVFGARSISIWHGTSGELVADSGDQLEQWTAQAYPAFFNSTNDEDNFDNRSDNKGPEPEGVAIGMIGANRYAFVGLERIGGVAVFDLNDVAAPEMAAYANNRDFVAGNKMPAPDSGPEIVRFVPADSSPNGEPMVVVANEVSGTVTLWRVSE
ncbi:MAG: choice-of-anchor I family protein [Pseudomonadales bacterium]|nr:choice-of-anchor I family protein [Pseudomonadales bacterium]